MNKVSEVYKDKTKTSKGISKTLAPNMKANLKEPIKTKIYYKDKTNN